MIIWIDGANGVGKSHVAAELAERLSAKDAEYIESDLYWMKFLQDEGNYLKCVWGHYGFTPCSNQLFLGVLRNILEEKVYDLGKVPIVSMSLVHKLCEIELLDYFEKKNVSMLHIILEAKEETIISRIENDSCRNENAQKEQKDNIAEQIRYLRTKYPNAIKIDTEGKAMSGIVNEIMALL